MKLVDFKWMTKRSYDPTGHAGRQIVLAFGEYELSIIDDGYGRDRGLLEIGTLKNGSMTALPGITDETDTVKGYLTEADVDAIIIKMYTISGKQPEQI
jgi:hypothetical protein